MTSTGGLSNLTLRTGELSVHERRLALGWRISWLPALTLLCSDLLAWPAMFLIFAELRTLLFGAPGEVVWQILIVPAVVTVLTFHVLGGYDRRTNMLSLSYAVEHFLGLAVAMMVSGTLVYGLCTFGSINQQPSRLFFFLAFMVFGVHALATRRWVSIALRTHHAGRHFVLLAAADVAARFATLFGQRGMRQELRIFSDFEAACSHLNAHADGVIVGYKPSSLDPQLGQFLAYVHFRHIPVYTLESFHETFWRQVPVQSIEAWWAFARESLLVRGSVYDHVKRVFDLVAAAAGLIVCAPLMLLVGIVVRVESPGPAIFRQTRIGRDGRPFTLFKFRSMRKGAECGSMYTADHDPRVTRAGQILRKTRMDELPQLWNVLRGDMSIIGPRAEWIKCVERYDGAIPFYGYRHLVRPGITGWAQVNYSYGSSSADAEEKLQYDLYYIRHYSMALDFAIILKTLQTMLFAKGR